MARGQHCPCIVQTQFIEGEVETLAEPSTVLVAVRMDRKGRMETLEKQDLK